MNRPVEPHREWQAIPGSTAQLMILDFTTNCMSSNAFIIKADLCMIVIDPGTLPEQLALIDQIMQDYLLQTENPVYILLTHSHHDHSKGLLSLPLDHPRLFTAVHQHGATALRNADHLISLAYIFGASCETIPVDIDLFSSQDIATRKSRAITTSHTLQTSLYPGIAYPFYQQRIPLNTSEDLMLYHTPGHSEDSISIQVGTYLFMGDLLFASQPAIAGIIGWNCEQLAQSCLSLEYIIQQEGITQCLNGHGPALSTEKTLHILKKIHETSGQMKDIISIDPSRSDFLKTYTHAAMCHITDLLTILSGQLYILSFQLDKMDDQEQADTLLHALDLDALDELLTFFSNRIEQYRCSSLQTTLPLKSLQTITKLKRIIQDNRLDTFLSPTLLARIEHTMGILSNTIHGFPIESTEEGTDIHDLLKTLIHNLQSPVHSAESIMDSIENPALFSLLLAKKMIQEPVLKKIRTQTCFEATNALLPVNFAYVYDYLLDIIEAYSTLGISDLTLCTETAQQGLIIKLNAIINGQGVLLSSRTRAYLSATAQLFNWTLAYTDTGLTLAFECSS